jgi:hypothetical protein
VSNLECPCGQVHELSARFRLAYANLTYGQPPDVAVTVPAGSWRVPRIYIAVHGLKAEELPALAARYKFPAA